MDLSKILIIDPLQLICNWYHDKVHGCVTNHRALREIRSQDEINPASYKLRTIKGNVLLLIPEVLDQINQLVVTKGPGFRG